MRERERKKKKERKEQKMLGIRNKVPKRKK